MGCSSSIPTNPIINYDGSSKPISLEQYNHDSPITELQLLKLRKEFWNTRVDGSSLMWQAIKSASEALLTNDSILSNAILEASNIKTPSGSLSNCFDERGFCYEIPDFACKQPNKLKKDQIISASSIDKQQANNIISNNKVKKDVRNNIIVKIKVNPGDSLANINANKSDTILELKNHIYVRSKNER
jgi:hypothetical protein